MNLRDLTEEDRKKLMQQCTDEFNNRNKARPEKPHQWLDYRTAFSDGVRCAIKLLGQH